MNANQSTCHPGEGTKALNRLPYLSEPLLRFDLQQELRVLRREDSWDRKTGRSSKTLAKYPDFRIVLVLMKAATHMEEHRAEARISIQVLVGKIRLHSPELPPVELSAEQLLALDAASGMTSKRCKRVRFCSRFPGRRAPRNRDRDFSSLRGVLCFWLRHRECTVGSYPAANPHRENIFVGAKPFTALDPARKEVHL